MALLSLFFAAEHQDGLIVISGPSLLQCSYVLQWTYLHSIAWSSGIVDDFLFFSIQLLTFLLGIDYEPTSTMDQLDTQSKELDSPTSRMHSVAQRFHRL